MAGLLRSHTVTPATIREIQVGADAFDWMLATVGSTNAAGYQLATRRPVMAIGGFNGTDPSPTLAEFQRYVSQGRIHFFVPGLEGGYPMGGSDNAYRITAWVRSNFRTVDVGGVTMYDLTAPLHG